MTNLNSFLLGYEFAVDFKKKFKKFVLGLSLCFSTDTFDTFALRRKESNVLKGGLTCENKLSYKMVFYILLGS